MRLIALALLVSFAIGALIGNSDGTNDHFRPPLGTDFFNIHAAESYVLGGELMFPKQFGARLPSPPRERSSRSARFPTTVRDRFPPREVGDVGDSKPTHDALLAYVRAIPGGGRIKFYVLCALQTVCVAAHHKF